MKSHRFWRSRRVLAVGIASVALVGVGGPTSAQSEEPSTELTSVRLLLPTNPSVTYFPWFIALDQGYFEDEGLQIELESVDGSGAVVQQISAGNAPFGAASASGDIAAFGTDDRLRAFACHSVGQSFRVVTPPDSGIATIADLAGRKLGVSDLSGGEIPVVGAILRGAGLEPSVDVELIPVGDASPALVRAITDRAVDAYSSGYNQMSSLRAAGVELVDLTPPEFAAIPTTCFIALSETLATEEGQAQAAAIGRAWAKGAAFGAADPAAAVAITCTFREDQCDNEPLANQLVIDTIPIITSADPDFPYAKIDVDAWQRAAQLLFDSGSTATLIDVSGLVGTPEVQAIQEGINAWSREDVQADVEAYSP